jgi:mono/diheme cytochrome c family protein
MAPKEEVDVPSKCRKIFAIDTIHSVWRVILAATLLLGQMAAVSLAEQPGKQDFVKYCAGCHGADGKGNGPDIYTLGGPKPPDLTDLGKQNGGAFPFQGVADTIDGTKSLPSHNRFDMPFWGVDLLEPGQNLTPESRARIQARINNIVRYVQSIQQR